MSKSNEYIPSTRYIDNLIDKLKNLEKYYDDDTKILINEEIEKLNKEREKIVARQLINKLHLFTIINSNNLEYQRVSMMKNNELDNKFTILNANFEEEYGMSYKDFKRYCWLRYEEICLKDDFSNTPYEDAVKWNKLLERKNKLKTDLIDVEKKIFKLDYSDSIEEEVLYNSNKFASEIVNKYMSLLACLDIVNEEEVYKDLEGLDNNSIYNNNGYHKESGEVKKYIKRLTDGVRNRVLKK